jgi:DNA modification methylase
MPHSLGPADQIAASIREFGFTNPILINRDNVVLAGHGRLAAAQEIGLASVPVIRIEHLNESQKRAYIIADNKIAQNAGWDPEILAIEFQQLTATDPDFELEITGFGIAEIDQILDPPTARTALDPLDALPNPGPGVTVPGDLWLLGPHRIICGDCRQPGTYLALMGTERARTVFADPPYNVPIDGHVGGLGKIKHREFAMASGEMTPAQFTAFLRELFVNLVAYSCDGSIHFICMDWRHIAETLAAGKDVYTELKNICVWNKDNGGMGSFYRSKHELVLIFKAGTAAHLNTIELGRSGRYRTNVWDYAGVNSMGKGRNGALAMHPTVKPTALVIDAIKDCSRRGDIVLDPCGGSGTTLIAAHKCRRQARLIEIDAAYVDTTIRRWQTLTGDLAVHATDGRRFNLSASTEQEEK